VVTEPTVKHTFPFLTKSKTEIYVGDCLQLEYEYSGDPSNLTWKTSYTDYLLVSQTGEVTGVAAGVDVITVTDGTITSKISIFVVERPVIPETKTVAFDLRLNGPLYDGVTKYKGSHIKFNLHSGCKREDGQSNDRTDAMYLASRQTTPGYYVSSERERNLYIVSSNPNVISVTNEYDGGWYEDYLRFVGAGTTFITITSWDGYSESFTIHVKDHYDFDPGKTYLTPGEFAYYATRVGVASGQRPDYHINSYRYLYLDAKELTWERAKGVGEGLAREWYSIGKDSILVVYSGWDETAQKHLFYIGYGEPGSVMEPYVQPFDDHSGIIRFPESHIIMTERTTRLAEVVGAQGDEFVVYSSSNPSVVETSGGFLLAQFPGEATITAKYKDQVVSMKVTVIRDPNIQRVRLNYETLSMTRFNPVQLSLLFYDLRDELVWTSSDPSVARVSKDGLVTGAGIGECIITVTDGVNSDSCIVRVYM
jgi:hypothetical protein